MSTTSPANGDPGGASDLSAPAVLAQAATAALRAPSILNTQPWHWHIEHDVLELRLDPRRRLPVVDPDNRLLTLSCGAALHHALTALAAGGHTAVVQRVPDPKQPELLARVRVTGTHRPDPGDVRRYEAIEIRRTDRRTVTDRPVPAESVRRLRDAAEHNGAHLHVVKPDEIPVLAVAVSRAAQAEVSDPAYRAELNRWTHRPAEARDGVSADTAVSYGPRQVPLRDFALDGTAALPPGEGTDRAATYLILFGDADEPGGWLRGGEALSAVLLAAVGEGLAMSPMSDVVEVAGAREQLRQMLSGLGYPYIVLRVGVGEPDEAVPPTPRREAADSIDINP